jgi:hypothetical protein
MLNDDAASAADLGQRDKLTSALCRAKGIAMCWLIAANSDRDIPDHYVHAIWALSSTINEALDAVDADEPEQQREPTSSSC